MPVSDMLFLTAVAASSVVIIEPAPTDGLTLLALAGFIVWGRRYGQIGGFILVGVLFLVLNVLATLVSDMSSHVTNVPYFLRMIATRIYVILAAVAAAIFAANATDRQRRLCLMLFVWAAVLCAIVAILAKLRVIPNYEFFYRDPSLIRLRGTFKDPNVMGPFMSSALILAAYLWLVGRSRRLIALLSLPIFAVLLLSGSRGGLLTFGCSLLAFAALVFRDRALVRNPLGLLAAGGLFMLVAGGVTYALAYYGGAFADLTARMSAQSYDVDRFATQYETFLAAFDEPWGHGIASSVHRLTGFSVNDPHNVYLKIAYEAGVVGLALFVLLLAVPLIASWRVARAQTCSPEVRAMAAAIFAILAGHAVNSWFIDSTHWRHFYLFMGFGVGLSRVLAVRRRQTRAAIRRPPPRMLTPGLDGLGA